MEKLVTTQISNQCQTPEGHQDCPNCDKNVSNECTSCQKTTHCPLYCFDCCSILTDAEIPDYFTLFSMDPCFKVDEQELEDYLEELMVVLHPDFYTQCEPREKTASLQYSALLQEARRTLLDPFKRAKYLLDVLGHKPKDTELNPPQGFIFSMFEMQEALDELEQGDNNPELAEEINMLLQSTMANLEDLFKKFKNQVDNQELKTELFANLGKLKFVLNLQTRLAEIQKKPH